VRQEGVLQHAATHRAREGVHMRQSAGRVQGDATVRLWLRWDFVISILVLFCFLFCLL
jgi:hypothetical protein